MSDDYRSNDLQISLERTTEELNRLKRKSDEQFRRYLDLMDERDNWKEMAKELSVYAQKHDHDYFRTCDVCRLLTKFVGMQRRG
jgi:hypothetical protein